MCSTIGVCRKNLQFFNSPCKISNHALAVLKPDKTTIFQKSGLKNSRTGDILRKVAKITLRGGAVVARQAHNLKARGSIPLPATNNYSASHSTGFFCAVKVPDTKGFAKTSLSIRPR